MTVPSSANRSGPYNGNGVTTVFNYGFRILDENHLTVIKTVGGVETVLVIDADYIVSDVGADAGGQIAVTPAPASGSTITILRNVPFTQETDLENQGAYFAETIEGALDRGVMRDQQLSERLDRAITIPASADGSALDELVEDVLRLADSADAIDTVASNIGAVNTAATNIAAIIDAPNQASAAAASAVAADASADAAALSTAAALASENNAAASADEAAGIVAGALQADNNLSDVGDATLSAGNLKLIERDTVAVLLADTILDYSVGSGKTAITTGQIVKAGVYLYKVAASGASDHHLTTSGGVKLYLVAFSALPLALGAAGDGVTNDTALVTAASAIASAQRPTFKTTLTEAPAFFDGPGDLILASPERRYSPRRIEGRKLAAPAGLGWTPPILPIFRRGRWTGHVSARSLIPAVVGTTYYVDPVFGNDSNAGDAANPFRLIVKALGMSDVGQVLVAPTANPTNSDGFWGNPTVTTSSPHVVVRPWNLRTGRVRVIAGMAHQESSWTVDGTSNNVYNATQAGVLGVVDFVGGFNGEPVFYAVASSKANCQNRPGTYYFDGTNAISVNTINGAVPSPSLKILFGNTCCYWPSNKGLYVCDIDFVGGGDGTVRVPDQSCDVIFAGCRAFGAQNASGNGFMINTSGTAILEDCVSGYHKADAFNYHKPASFSAGKVVEVNCRSMGVSGVGVALSNQISTSHDGTLVARYGCEYDGSGDQIIADVNTGTKSWNVGLQLGASRDEATNSLGVYLSESEGWFYDSDLGHSTTGLQVMDGSAHLHNCSPAAATSGAGTITAYEQS